MIKEVHIFKAGTQTSAQGTTREFTKKDLEEIASSYDSGVHEAPIRIGHEDNDKVPAWGWVKGVKVKGDELFAEVDFSPLAEDYVKNGLYKKVSASFYSPESKINPEPGKWSLRHVALLGAQPPAVKGLKGFAYEESGDGIVDFATTLSPDAVFDPELGPTLKRDLGPLEILKEKLDEARAEMNTQEQAMEQQLEAPAEVKEETAAGEFAEGEMTGMKKPKKKMNGEKMGTEGESSDEDEDDDTMMAAEMAGSKLPEALKKNAAKKRAEKTGKSMDEAMAEDEEDEEDEEKDKDFASCGSKKSKKMSYSEEDEVEHGEGKVTMPRSDKMGKPSPKGMSGLPEECPEGEGPVASKVKKDAKSGHGMEDEDKFEEDGEPTFEPSKKKRGADGMKSSDTGVTSAEDGPGGLVRTRSSSKGVNLGYAEEELEQDDEQHMEDDSNDDKYTKRGKVGKPDSMAETGRKKTGKAKEIKGYPDGEGKNSESGKHSEIKGYPDGEGMNSEKGDDGGEQDKDRKKKGTAKEIKGYPDSYMSTGMGGGNGKQVKGGKVRVMAVNHSESDDPIAAMMARLEELEAANARLREQAEFAERQANRMRLEQFAEGLYESGKLTDAVVSQEQLVDYMEGLEYGTLEFAEGESAATPLMKILESLPAQVCFEELAGGAVETHEEELDPHRQALKIKEEEGIEYSEALKRVLFPAE
jgi:hypothetical protein